jgi:RimJ/RimL family protein N-acetyltransferase
MSDAEVRSRFLDGLAAAAGVDRASLARPRTTVVGRDDRAGSGALACYRADRHLVLWGDPAVVDRVAHLDDPTTTPAAAPLRARLASAGFELVAEVVSNVLAGQPIPPVELTGPYRHHWLAVERPDHVDAVRAFVARCDPADVEAAALDELDDGYDDEAINVCSPLDVEDLHPVAYASASRWTWDPDFGDIGVLVEPDHRGRGLGRFVAAHTVERLFSVGRLPLYRHEVSNHGSRAIAAGLGFEPVVTLAYFVLAGEKAAETTGNGDST